MYQFSVSFIIFKHNSGAQFFNIHNKPVFINHVHDQVLDVGPSSLSARHVSAGASPFVVGVVQLLQDARLGTKNLSTWDDTFWSDPTKDSLLDFHSLCI